MRLEIVLNNTNFNKNQIWSRLTTVHIPFPKHLIPRKGIFKFSSQKQTVSDKEVDVGCYNRAMSMFKVKVFINVELTPIHHLCLLLRESIWWTATVAAFWIHQHILAENARPTHSSPPMTKDSRSYLLGMKILCHETLDQR